MIPPVGVSVLVVINNEDIKSQLVFLWACYLPILLLAVIFSLNQLEWYRIYSNRIEAIGIFGIKNTVFFSKVLYVEKTEIPLTDRGMIKSFFIFNDGRKNNDNILDTNSCYNRKKYNFRIYITPKLEEYISKTLGLEIKCN